MDAVEYLKEKARMTQLCKIGCSNCELSSLKHSGYNDCLVFELANPEEAVAIIEKWSAEHPVKTRQSEFLKRFPNAKVNNRILQVCPRKIDTCSLSEEECRHRKCSDCYETYWLAEVE